MKLKNKYVIGCHVMFYEIAMYEEYIEGLINLLETVDNKENVYLYLCFNVSEKISIFFNFHEILSTFTTELLKNSILLLEIPMVLDLSGRFNFFWG